MNGFTMLDPVMEDTDDVELAYWEAVEHATHDDDDDESAVTSPYWVTVEQIMGCKLCSKYIFVTAKLLIVVFCFSWPIILLLSTLAKSPKEHLLPSALTDSFVTTLYYR